MKKANLMVSDLTGCFGQVDDFRTTAKIHSVVLYRLADNCRTRFQCL